PLGGKVAHVRIGGDRREFRGSLADGAWTWLNPLAPRHRQGDHRPSQSRGPNCSAKEDLSHSAGSAKVSKAAQQPPANGNARYVPPLRADSGGRTLAGNPRGRKRG